LTGAPGETDDLIWARFEAIDTLSRLLAPMMPHLAEEIAGILRPGAGLLAEQPWPKAQESLLTVDEVTLAVQVNGKLKGTITVPTGQNADQNIAIAKQAVSGALNGMAIVKEIHVPDRIVNFVVKPQ